MWTLQKEEKIMIGKSCLLTLFLFLVSLLLITAKTSGATWTTEAVDAPKIFTDFYSRSLTVGTDDHPHIAYGGDHLYYAFYDGTSWNYETVDLSTGVGECASIALDSSGKVHISYYDSTNGDLKYATTDVPVPDIKANGSDGSVTPTDNLLVTVALDPASRSSDDAVWWVVVNTPFAPPNDWYHYELSSEWTSGLSFTYQGPLFNLPTSEILNFPVSFFPSGTYTFYLAVDMNMNCFLTV